MKMKRILAGLYRVNFAYGHVGIVKRLEDGEWSWSIIDRASDLCAFNLAQNKRAAELQMYNAAADIKVEDTNMMTGKTILVSITTPRVCNPASESYWSA
jgi:hypothetical protein